MKRCRACEKEFPIKYFAPSMMRKRDWICRPCVNAYRRGKRKTPEMREKERIRQQEWRAIQTVEQRMKQAERARLWRKNNPDKYKAQYMRVNALTRDKRKDYMKKWHAEHGNYERLYANKQYSRCRKLVFDYYGWKCSCCGEAHEEFLTMDHVGGGGRKHSREVRKALYIWLVRHNFPEGFRTLCMNCNFALGKKSGYCPHQRDKLIKPFHDRLPLMGVFS